MKVTMTIRTELHPFQAVQRKTFEMDPEQLGSVREGVEELKAAVVPLFSAALTKMSKEAKAAEEKEG